MIVVEMAANTAMKRYIHIVVFIALIIFDVFLAVTMAIDVLIAWPRNLILPRNAFVVPYSFFGDALNAAVVFWVVNNANPIPRIS